MNKRDFLEKAGEIYKQGADHFRPVSVVVNALAFLIYFASRNQEIKGIFFIVLFFSIMIDACFYLVEKFIKLIIWIIEKRRKKIQKELFYMEAIIERVRRMEEPQRTDPELREIIKEYQGYDPYKRIAFLKKRLGKK